MQQNRSSLHGLDETTRCLPATAKDIMSLFWLGSVVNVASDSEQMLCMERLQDCLGAGCGRVEK